MNHSILPFSWNLVFWREISSCDIETDSMALYSKKLSMMDSYSTFLFSSLTMSALMNSITSLCLLGSTASEMSLIVHVPLVYSPLLSYSFFRCRWLSSASSITLSLSCLSREESR